ncbi:MAG TPA: hypothetical protein VKR58_14800 [Aquella sp.]|nr:hypothetical protein [Aquella sp.]
MVPGVNLDGVIEYGYNKKAVYWKMEDSFGGKLNMELYSQSICKQVDMSYVAELNSSLTAPVIDTTRGFTPLITSNEIIDNKEINGPHLDIAITNLENKGNDVEYTCLVSNDCHDGSGGTYFRDPNICTISIKEDHQSNPFIAFGCPKNGNHWCVKIQADRMQGYDVDNETDYPETYYPEVDYPTVFSNAVSVPLDRCPNKTPITPTQLQPIVIPPKPPRVEMSYYHSSKENRYSVLSGIVHNVDTSGGVTYECLLSSTDGTVENYLPPKHNKCTFVKNGNNNDILTFAANYSYDKSDEYNNQYLVIKATRGTSADSPTSFSNPVLLKDTTTNNCTYRSRTHSKGGTICYPLPECKAPEAIEVASALFSAKDNKVELLFNRNDILDRSFEVLNYKGEEEYSPIKIASTTDTTITVDDENIKDHKADYYDYRVYRRCEGGQRSTSYCPIRVYNDGLHSLVCGEKR